MDKPKALLCSLEERLVEHDENRKVVQAKMNAICNKASEEATFLEEKIGCEIRKEFDSTEEGTLSTIGELNNKLENPKEGDELDTLIEKARKCLVEQKYEIEQLENAQNFVDSYKLTVSSTPINEDNVSVTNKIERIASLLQMNLEKTHESMISAQGRLLEICNKRREEAEEMKKRVNGKLGELFTKEDARLQGVLKEVREKIGSESPSEVKEVMIKAKTTLITKSKYSLENSADGLSLGGYDLVVTEEVSLGWLCFEERKPTNFVPSFSNGDEVSLSFAFFDEEETMFLKPFNLPFKVEVMAWEKDNESATETHTREYSVSITKPPCFRSNLIVPDSTRCLKVRLECCGARSGWSDVGKFTTPGFKELCIWKRSIEDGTRDKMYSVDEKSPRIATKVSRCYCIIPGNAAIPPNRIVSWGIKVLKSALGNGGLIYVGIVPFDSTQERDKNIFKSGWYFEPSQSRLHSGPPHNYDAKEYGPLKPFRKTIKDGSTVGVVMDTGIGTLSFTVDNKSYGVAYERIPFDKPLLPCAILYYEGDSVELDIFEVKKKIVGVSIHPPSNITATSGTTWDSITLTWDPVKGATFYQIEVNGSKFWELSPTNTFTKRGLLADTEHTFRVRTMKGTKVGKWSDVVKGKTLKKLIESSWWKECPDYVDEFRKYSVDEKNPRIATKIREYCCTIIGNTPLPLDTVTSWSIKILNSKNNDCQWVYVGVAPSNIYQNESENYKKCGWYFDCHFSILVSGPPHNYKWKIYGPRLRGGKYVHIGDSVGVIMGTAKGELSFVVNGVNLGVAYEGIPLDKPLVPCVVLECQGDSVELVI